MPRYLLSAHMSGEPRQPMTEDQMRRGFEVVEAVETELRAHVERPSYSAVAWTGLIGHGSCARRVRSASG